MQLTHSVFRTNIHKIVVNVVVDDLVHVGLAFENTHFPVDLNELVGQKHHEGVETGCSEAVLVLLEDQASDHVLPSPRKQLVMVVITGYRVSSEVLRN